VLHDFTARWTRCCAHVRVDHWLLQRSRGGALPSVYTLTVAAGLREDAKHFPEVLIPAVRPSVPRHWRNHPASKLHGSAKMMLTIFLTSLLTSLILLLPFSLAFYTTSKPPQTHIDAPSGATASAASTALASSTTCSLPAGVTTPLPAWPPSANNPPPAHPTTTKTICPP
jgi:hypothetical protein